jgi:hypothetical protein
MSAQLHCHILVMYHLHPGDILLYLIGLELILLPVGQEVVDGVLQLTLVATDPLCDGLHGGIGNSIAARGPESWSLVSAEDSGSEENLCYGFELHPPWTRDFLNPVPGSGGDAQVFQQSSKPAGDNWSFDPKGLHLIHISVHLLDLGVTRGRVLFVGFLHLGPSAAAAPQQASHEPLGSQEPPALSQKAPLPVMLLEVRRAMTPRVVAHFEVPADQRAVSQCSCMLYGECEPSII